MLTINSKHFKVAVTPIPLKQMKNWTENTKNTGHIRFANQIDSTICFEPVVSKIYMRQIYLP